MIITFFGHGSFKNSADYSRTVLEILECRIGDNEAEIYLGGYGYFDNFAYECCKKYKLYHPRVRLVYVTPYINESYQKNHLKEAYSNYDLILYPPIEEKPPKFAIKYRNRYMVEKADFVIFYIEHKWGGAYQAYLHAIRNKKEILNLSNRII